MSYASPQALRAALDQRIANSARERGIAIDRLRRRVTFERILRRLTSAEPEQWVLKGGMALEVRLRDRARVTKDIDLGLREKVTDGECLRDRVIDALGIDPDNDRFRFSVGAVQPLGEDAGGEATWRLAVVAYLGDRKFDSVKLDVSPRPHELAAVDRIAVPTELAFAGAHAAEIQVIDLARHAAEKLHAMTRSYGGRESSRTRDLVDIVLLHEQGLLDHAAIREATVAVWRERDRTSPPRNLPPVPPSWQDRYEGAAEDLDLYTADFADAVAVVRELWLTLHPTEDS